MAAQRLARQQRGEVAAAVVSSLLCGGGVQTVWATVLHHHHTATTASDARSNDSVVVGGGNVLVGLMGGRVMIFSSVSLLNALLTDKKSRVATWMCAVVGFCFLSVGHLLMAYAPKFICGGALFFLGVDTINQTVVANFHKLPTSEFITLISVLAVYILINDVWNGSWCFFDNWYFCSTICSTFF